MARFGGGGVFTQPVDGTVAHGAVDDRNPVKIGGKAVAAEPAAVDDGDRVNAYFDLNGRQHVVVDESIDVEVSGDAAHDALDAGNPMKIGGRAHSFAPAAVAAGDRVNAYFDVLGKLGTFSELDEAIEEETGVVTKGVMLLLDNGTNGTFGQCDASGYLKTTLQTEIPAGINEIGGVNQTKVAGTAVAVGSGALSAGVQRVAIATDDVNMSAIKTAVEKIDDIQDATVAEASVATKGIQISLDNGTTTTFAQCDASGNLKTIPILNGTTTETWPQLTAPGSTDAKACLGYSKHTIQYTVATIDTSVTVRVEGSLDNTSWFNLSSGDTDTTDDANGTYGIIFEGALAYIRFGFVSEVGGTAATIDAKYLGMV